MERQIRYIFKVFINKKKTNIKWLASNRSTWPVAERYWWRTTMLTNIHHSLGYTERNINFSYTYGSRREGNCRMRSWWDQIGRRGSSQRLTPALFSRENRCSPASPGRIWRHRAHCPWCPRTSACQGHRSQQPWIQSEGVPGQISSNEALLRNPR